MKDIRRLNETYVYKKKDAAHHRVTSFRMNEKQVNVIFFLE